MKIKKKDLAKIQDEIIKAFEGLPNPHLTWDTFRDDKYKKIIHENYNVIEGQISFLISEGLLNGNRSSDDKRLSLTDKGIAIMVNNNIVGYQCKQEEFSREKRWLIFLRIISVATFIIVACRAYYDLTKSPDQSKVTLQEQMPTQKLEATKFDSIEHSAPNVKDTTPKAIPIKTK